MVSRLRVPSQKAEYNSVNAPWTYFLSPAGPDRSVVSSNPGDRGSGDQGADQPHRVRDQDGGLSQAGVDEPGRHHAAGQVRDQKLRPLDRDVLEDRQVDGHRRQPRPDGQRRVRHPGRAGRDVDPPARAPRLVQVMLVSPGRLRLGDVLLLAGPGDAQVSGAGQVSAARAVPLREVIDDLVRLAPAHRRTGRPGLLPRLPLPLRGAPLLPGRRPALRQVIGARRHRGVTGIPRRGPQGRVQLPPATPLPARSAPRSAPPARGSAHRADPPAAATRARDEIIPKPAQPRRRDTFLAAQP